MEKQSSELKSKFSLLGERRGALEIVGVTEIEEADSEIEDAVDIKAGMTTIGPVDPELASTVVRRVT